MRSNGPLTPSMVSLSPQTCGPNSFITQCSSPHTVSSLSMPYRWPTQHMLIPFSAGDEVHPHYELSAMRTLQIAIQLWSWKWWQRFVSLIYSICNLQYHPFDIVHYTTFQWISQYLEPNLNDPWSIENPCDTRRITNQWNVKTPCVTVNNYMVRLLEKWHKITC